MLTNLTNWISTCQIHHPCQRHPLFSVYGSDKPSWSWILVVGREPRIDGCLDGSVGQYALERAGEDNVQFWSRSHKRLSWAARIQDIDLRPWAVQVGSSPIAYADAGPRGQTNGSIPWVSKSDLETHAHNLGAVRELDNCRLVLISGSEQRPSYQPFYRSFEALLTDRGIAFAYVPFFGRPVTNAEIMPLLYRQPVQTAIHDVVRTWAQAHDILHRWPGGEVVARKPPC